MIERSLLMKTNSKKFSIKDWFEKNKLYILAFVLPILSMLIVYYFKNRRRYELYGGCRLLSYKSP